MHAWGFQLISSIGLIFSKSIATILDSQFQIQLLDHFASQATYSFSSVLNYGMSLEVSFSIEHSPFEGEVQSRFRCIQHWGPSYLPYVISFPAFTVAAPNFNRKRRNSSVSHWHHAILPIFRSYLSLLNVWVLFERSSSRIFRSLLVE